MYYVVIGEGWCSVMPMSWVDTKEKFCFWPPKGFDKLKAIKKCKQPVLSWSRVHFKYTIGPISTYEEARELEKASAMVTSDDCEDNFSEKLAATARDVLPEKRTIKRTRFSSSSDDDRSLLTKKLGKEKIIPQILSPPTNYNYSSGEKEDGEDTVDNPRQCESKKTAVSKGCFPDISGVSQASDIQVGDNIYDDSQVLDTQGLELGLNVNGNGKSLIVNDEGETLSILELIQHNFNELQKKMNEGFDSIHRRLERLERKINTQSEIMEETNPVHPNHAQLLENLPEFPINDLEEFKKFSNELQTDKELRKYFIKKIIKIGGSNPKRHLVNILVFTLTNKLGKVLTWEGQRNTEGIKLTAFSTIILRTLAEKYMEVTFDELEKTFSEWLRRSGDRYRNQIKSKTK